jgi:hypothetical protein
MLVFITNPHELLMVHHVRLVQHNPAHQASPLLISSHPVFRIRDILITDPDPHYWITDPEPALCFISSQLILLIAYDIQKSQNGRNQGFS